MNNSKINPVQLDKTKTYKDIIKRKTEIKQKK